MDTRTPTWRLLLLPVGFTLACVVLLIVAWLSIGGSTPLGAKGYRVTVPLRDASNLVPGSDVQIAGVRVGDVVAIERAGRGSDAEIELRARYAPLRSGASAIVRTKTLLGEGYLELAPGHADAPSIPEGGRLSAGRVRDRQQLDQVLSTFDPRMRDGLRRLFAGTATAFDGREQQLSNVLGQLSPTLASMERVLADVDAQGSRVRRLVGSSADVLDALGSREGSLQVAVRAGDQVLDATASRDRALAATLRALPPFLGQLERTSNGVTRASGDLNRAVAALRPVAPRMPRALRAIHAAAPEFERLFAALPATIRAGRAGLPSLTRIARTAQPAFRAIYPTTRELIPTVALAAANRYDMTSVFGNVASFLNGLMYGPHGRKISFPAATLGLSNELIGGYKQRLPTNRLNPYVKPSGMKAMADQRFLNSFDCRNVGNPLIVPAIGAMPPCREQGKWEFQGRSAYYPALQPAKP